VRNCAKLGHLFARVPADENNFPAELQMRLNWNN